MTFWLLGFNRELYQVVFFIPSPSHIGMQNNTKAVRELSV